MNSEWQENKICKKFVWIKQNNSLLLRDGYRLWLFCIKSFCLALKTILWKYLRHDVSLVYCPAVTLYWGLPVHTFALWTLCLYKEHFILVSNLELYWNCCLIIGCFCAYTVCSQSLTFCGQTFFCRWSIIVTAWQLQYWWQRNDFTALLLGAITLPYNRPHLLWTCHEPSTASWRRTRSRQPSEVASFAVAKSFVSYIFRYSPEPSSRFPTH